MKKIFLTTIILTFSLNIAAQNIVGYYVYRPKKKISLFGLLPHFQSSGYLNINSDSTYHSEISWESFVDQSSGSWRLFEDTLLLYPNKKELIGDHIYKSYSYSYSRNDTMKERNVFTISSLVNNSIPNNNAYIFIGQTKEKIQFRDGIYTLQNPSFDSLIIKFKKQFNYNQIKIEKPVCCGENVFYITIGLKMFQIDKEKIKDLKGNVIFKKNKSTKP